MSASTPVDRVAELLEAANFRRLPTPLQIGDLKFQVPAAFIGSDRTPDLVLIADTAFENERRILRQIEGIGRALDIMESKRPLTVVLAGPRPTAETMEALSKVARILPIGSSQGGDTDTALYNWLAVLLPLKLPEANEGIADPLQLVRTQLSGLAEPVATLVESAQNGTRAVQASLHAVLRSAFAGTEQRHD